MLNGSRECRPAGFDAKNTPGEQSCPSRGASPADMLSTIGKTAPPFLAQMLGELKAASWQPMNSYVHGGVRSVVQAMNGGTTQQLDGVLRNANGLALLTGNLLILALGDPALAGRVRQIQVAHMACMPPPRNGAP